MSQKLPPIHPGEILFEEFLEPMGISQYRLATHLVIACLIFAACMWIYRGLCPHAGAAGRAVLAVRGEFHTAMAIPIETTPPRTATAAAAISSAAATGTLHE